jgi:peptidoglycan hydrolase CwlO-like protein
MTTEDSAAPETPSFGSRLNKAFLAFLRALVRLVLILLVAVAIGLVAYIVVPRVYQQYVKPVQENTSAINELRNRQDQAASLVDNQLAALQERLDTLEVQGDQDKQTIAELQDELVALEAMIAGQDTALGATNEQAAQLGEDLEALNTTLAQIRTRLNNVTQELSENVKELAGDAEANQEEISNLALEFNATGNPINALRRELQLVKAMELITRSRVEIAQQNLGLVEADIQRARDLLLALEPLVFEFQQESLLTIVSRLDLALENFPDDLDLVEADLEVAWELLLAGLPMEPEVEGEGQSLVGELTPTPTEDETATPEPEPTPTPTS